MKSTQPNSEDTPSSQERALEDTLGYHFENEALLETALTHPSYRNETGAPADNQRLEFLGDALIGFLLADRVFRHHTTKPEGMLTVLRASVVNGSALAAKAAKIGIGTSLLLGQGEKTTGGRQRESNLADAFESIMGAVYLDGGFDAASRVFDRLFADEINSLGDDPWMQNPKGRLQYEAHKLFNAEPEYETISSAGPQHRPQFNVRVSVGDALSADGAGSTKQLAQTAAAVALLALIKDRREVQS